MNPFLDDSYFPAWSKLTADQIEPAIKKGIELAKANLDKIKAVTPEAANYDNTFAALEKATEDLSRAWGRLQHLDSVRDTPEQRDELNKMLPEVSAFYSSISLDGDLWKVLKNFSESPAIDKLSPIQKRFIDETRQDFINSGANLPEDKQARYAEIESELAQLTQDYGENVLDSTNAFDLIIPDPDRLKGIPESAVEAARQDPIAQKKGSDDAPAYRFTLQYPSLLPVLKYADDAQLRKDLYMGHSNIGNTEKHQNEELVKKIIKLRDEKAKILGYANFPAYVVERRMAKKPETVLDFITSLHGQIEKQHATEVTELEKFKAEQTKTEPAPLDPWEVSYWSEKLRKDRYDLDEEALRPYFSVDGVMDGMFDIAT